MTTIIVETSANTLKLQDFRRALLSDNGIPISAVPTGITEHQWCITGITTPVLFQEVGRLHWGPPGWAHGAVQRRFLWTCTGDWIYINSSQYIDYRFQLVVTQLFRNAPGAALSACFRNVTRPQVYSDICQNIPDTCFKLRRASANQLGILSTKLAASLLAQNLCKSS